MSTKTLQLTVLVVVSLLTILVIFILFVGVIRARFVGETEEWHVSDPTQVPLVGGLLSELDSRDVYVRRTIIVSPRTDDYWVVGRCSESAFKEFATALAVRDPGAIVAFNNIQFEDRIGSVTNAIDLLRNVQLAPTEIVVGDLELALLNVDDDAGRWQIHGAFSRKECKFVLLLAVH